MNTSNIYRYWKVGRLLHFVAFLALVVALISYLRLSVTDFSTESHLWYMWLVTFIMFFNMCILAELDGYSRFQNYKQVKDQMFINGFQERQLKPLLKSSCQREAAILAGEELGLEKEVRNYFWDCGYRWYHVIPDFVFENPIFLFSSFFWRTTFFTPYYKPKVNYESIDFSNT